MNNDERLARIFKVLSVGTRVQILRMLKGKPYCVNALACRLQVTQGAVSQHLRIMRDAGLVIDDKRGYFVHYRVNEQTLAKWNKELGALLAPPASSEIRNPAGNICRRKLQREIQK